MELLLTSIFQVQGENLQKEKKICLNKFKTTGKSTNRIPDEPPFCVAPPSRYQVLKGRTPGSCDSLDKYLKFVASLS